MRQQNELLKVKAIAELVGARSAQITPLTRGATSAAYRVDDDKRSLIVRLIPTGTNRPVTYQSEFTILRMLQAKGAPVPQPILTSTEAGALLFSSEPWAVTSIVPGMAIGKTPVSPTTACELGLFLKVLHALPVSGFGRLCEEAARLCGQQADPVTGLCARWCWAPLWPFDGSVLWTHPIAHCAPELVSRLMSLQDNLTNIANEGDAVLNHSDLHGEHIFVFGDKLTGIIDFGATAISTPAWDFAVIAFYHGWQTCQTVLDSYADLPDREQLLMQTQKVAIILALYKTAKAIQADADHAKVNKIVQFLANVLYKF